MSTLLVLVEHASGAPTGASLQALGAARAVSDDVVAVLLGDGAEGAAAGLGAKGAARAIVLPGDTSSPDACAAAIAAQVQETGAKGFRWCSS